MKAGANALEFNAPLGSARADALIGNLTASTGTVADLGCGRGSFLRRFAAAAPNRSAIGVDSDAELIAYARSQSPRSDHLTFEVDDASTWAGETDLGAVIAVGVSHVFGGPAATFDHLASICPTGIAVVGDGIWSSQPDPWCLETFGDQPAGVDALADLAITAGWKVIGSDASTIDEWDAFEHGWIEGVRAVETTAAHAFADERAAEYERYRGVLGFAWLTLARHTP